MNVVLLPIIMPQTYNLKESKADQIVVYSTVLYILSEVSRGSIFITLTPSGHFLKAFGTCIVSFALAWLPSACSAN